MPCDDFNAMLAFIEGTIAPTDRLRYQTHLQNCESCRAVFAAMDAAASSPAEKAGHAARSSPASPKANLRVESRSRQAANLRVESRSRQAANLRVESRSRQAANLRGPISVGDTIGRYCVTGWMGKGAMGTVFRAHDPELRRDVALKVLQDNETDGTGPHQQRLAREARNAARITHPNVASVFDSGRDAGIFYLVMELVEGESLAFWLSAKPRSWREVLATFLQAARGLEAAHASDVVHRDFKPGNVLIAKDGTVKVVDFGLSRVRSGKEQEGGTQESAQFTIVGTPKYMAPEQWAGKAPDPLTDQFSFCVALYEALKPPTPRRLAAIVLRGMNADPRARFPSMRALREALESTTRTMPRARVSIPAARATFIALVVIAATLLGSRALRVRAERSSSPVPPPAHLDRRTVAGTAVTELPISPKCNKQAESNYREGLLDIQGASWELAYEAFKKASTADPSCADVQLQLIIVGSSFETIDQVRMRFHRALSLRDDLDERGRALLDAYTPYILDEKADTREWARRLDEVASRFPLDAQVLETAADAFANTPFDPATEAHVLELLERANQIDPKYGDALQARGRALVYLGRSDEALDLLAKCIEVAPGSAGCISERIRALRPHGRCAAIVDDARRWIANAPTSFRAHLELANALASTGASAEAVETVISTDLPGNDLGGRREYLRLYYRGLLAVLGGDFGKAEKWVEQLLQHAKGSSVLFEHARAMAVMADLLIETGQKERASAIAKQFFRQKQGWTEGFWAPSESEPFLASVSLEQQKSSLDAWRASADQWEERARIHSTRRQLWVFRWAPAVDALEPNAHQLAQEAWSHLPDEIPTASTGGQFPYYPALVDMLQGRIALVAGETTTAIELLEPSSKSCDRLQIPFNHVRAHLWLGQAKERTGDRAGACEAYDYVLQYWGNAKPRSVTAEEAKRRSHVLGCKSKG